MLSEKAQEQMKKYIDNHNWFRDNYKRLQERYNGKYVAVKDKNYFDSDTDFIKLIERLRTNSNFEKSIYIDIVSNNNLVIMH